MAEEENKPSSSDEAAEALRSLGPAQDRPVQDEAQEAEAAGRVQELESEVGHLRSALEERDGELAGLREQVASAAARYRAALLTGAPEVPEELVQGQTVEELDESLATARRVVDKVARQLEERVASERVPSGAPPRRQPDLGALSAREKILYALQRG